MGNGGGETWGKYLSRLTRRPGWSIAELARRSGVNEATIHEYIRKEIGGYVKTDTLLALARGAEDDPINAFRAAAGIAVDDPDDQEIAMVLGSNLSDPAKNEILEGVMERRRADRERGIEHTVRMIRLAGGKDKAS